MRDYLRNNFLLVTVARNGMGEEEGFGAGVMLCGDNLAVLMLQEE